mgnify:FL=1
MFFKKEEIKNNLDITEFKLPKGKSECKMIDSDNISELISLLKNEAKVL